MGDINWLWSVIGWSGLKLSNLFQALQEYKNLSSPRKSPAKAERKLALIEEKLNPCRSLGSRTWFYPSHATVYALFYRYSY